MRAAIPFDPGLEHKSNDEEKTQENLLSTILKIEKLVFRKRARAGRGVHAKSIGLLRGVLTVSDALPDELAQGLFAKPGAYEATIRLSTIPGDPLPDTVSVPRGFAIKIAGVKGKVLSEAKGHQVQDFLFATGRAFSAPSPKKFLHSLKLLALTTERMLWMKKTMSRVFRPIQKVATYFGHPVAPLDILGGHLPTHPLGECFFSQAPLRYGKYVAKFGIFPESQNFQALAENVLNIDSDPEALRHAVADVMQREGGSWSLRVQLRRDVEMNPIEDASVIWPEEDNPYLTVAIITVPPQEGWSEELSRAVDDALSFAPWHGLIEHQPLGAVMRARRGVYARAAAARSAMNQRRVYIFPPWVPEPKKPRKPASAPKKTVEATPPPSDKPVDKGTTASKGTAKTVNKSTAKSATKPTPETAAKPIAKSNGDKKMDKSTLGKAPLPKSTTKTSRKASVKATRTSPKPPLLSHKTAKASPANSAKTLKKPPAKTSKRGQHS